MRDSSRGAAGAYSWWGNWNDWGRGGRARHTDTRVLIKGIGCGRLSLRFPVSPCFTSPFPFLSFLDFSLFLTFLSPPFLPLELRHGEKQKIRLGESLKEWNRLRNMEKVALEG